MFQYYYVIDNVTEFSVGRRETLLIVCRPIDFRKRLIWPNSINYQNNSTLVDKIVITTIPYN